MLKSISLRAKLYVIYGITLAILTLAVSAGLYGVKTLSTELRYSGQNTKMMTQIDRFTYQMTHGHLIYEEVMAGDTTETFEQALSHVKIAIQSLDSSRHQLEKIETSAEHRQRLLKLHADAVQHANGFYMIGESASKDPKFKKIGFAGSDLEGKFDSEFEGAISNCDSLQKEIENWMDQRIIYDENNSHQIEWLVWICFIAGVVILTVIPVIARDVGRVIQGLLQETQSLIFAAKEGRLDHRGDSEKIHPEFRPIIVGFNEVLDSFILPLQTAIQFLDSAAKGESVPQIKHQWSGAFEQLAGALNQLGAAQSQIGNLAKEMAEGNFRLDVKPRSEQDELMTALSVMLQRLRGMFAEIASGVSTLANSSSDLKLISEQLNFEAGQSADRSNTVSIAAEKMSGHANFAANGMTQATINLTTIATATEEMSATISEIANNSEKARLITGEASRQADSLTHSIHELGSAAQEIGHVTQTINAISSQTNLLALNATIEAARAGSAGKGFAVVANEIKDLARQTAQSTEDIKHRIDSIQKTTGTAVVEIEKITKVIREVSEIVAIIATAVEEQSLTTREIATNINMASHGVQDANEKVGQNSTTIAEVVQDILVVNQSSTTILNASERVQTGSNTLAGLASQLQESVQKFRV